MAVMQDNEEVDAGARVPGLGVHAALASWRFSRTSTARRDGMQMQHPFRPSPCAGRYAARILLWPGAGRGAGGAPDAPTAAADARLDSLAAPGFGTGTGAVLPLASSAPDVPCAPSPLADASAQHHRRAVMADALPPGVQVDLFGSEVDLLQAFVDAVQSLDPDIVLGYEVQMGSLGYLRDRTAALGRTDFLRALSRTPKVRALRRLIFLWCGRVWRGRRAVPLCNRGACAAWQVSVATPRWVCSDGARSPCNKTDRPCPSSLALHASQLPSVKENFEDEYGWLHFSGIDICGRVVLNVWRIMQSGARGGTAPAWGCKCKEWRSGRANTQVLRGRPGRPWSPTISSRGRATQLDWLLRDGFLHCAVDPAASPPACLAELKLSIYTLENVVAAVLQLRIPHVPASQLHAWFTGGPVGEGGRACWVRPGFLRAVRSAARELCGPWTAS